MYNNQWQILGFVSLMFVCFSLYADMQCMKSVARQGMIIWSGLVLKIGIPMLPDNVNR